MDNNLFKYDTRQLHADFPKILSLFLFGLSLSLSATDFYTQIKMLGFPDSIDCAKLSVNIWYEPSYPCLSNTFLIPEIACTMYSRLLSPIPNKVFDVMKNF